MEKQSLQFWALRMQSVWRPRPCPGHRQSFSAPAPPADRCPGHVPPLQLPHLDRLTGERRRSQAGRVYHVISMLLHICFFYADWLTCSTSAIYWQKQNKNVRFKNDTLLKYYLLGYSPLCTWLNLPRTKFIPIHA